MTLPSNFADAAASIRDGNIGLIEQVKIGDMIVSALTGLDGGDSLTVTRKPVESGFSISDAAVRQPLERLLDVCLANPDYGLTALTTAALTGSVTQLYQTWREKKDYLYSVMDNKEVITVQTHERVYDNMLISSIVPRWDVNANYDAFFCSVSIVQIENYTTENYLDFTIDSELEDAGPLT